MKKIVKKEEMKKWKKFAFLFGMKESTKKQTKKCAHIFAHEP